MFLVAALCIPVGLLFLYCGYALNTILRIERNDYVALKSYSPTEQPPHFSGYWLMVLALLFEAVCLITLPSVRLLGLDVQKGVRGILDAAAHLEPVSSSVEAYVFLAVSAIFFFGLASLLIVSTCSQNSGGGSGLGATLCRVPRTLLLIDVVGWALAREGAVFIRGCIIDRGLTGVTNESTCWAPFHAVVFAVAALNLFLGPLCQLLALMEHAPPLAFPWRMPPLFGSIMVVLRYFLVVPIIFATHVPRVIPFVINIVLSVALVYLQFKFRPGVGKSGELFNSMRGGSFVVSAVTSAFAIVIALVPTLNDSMLMGLSFIVCVIVYAIVFTLDQFLFSRMTSLRDSTSPELVHKIIAYGDSVFFRTTAAEVWREIELEAALKREGKSKSSSSSLTPANHAVRKAGKGKDNISSSGSNEDLRLNKTGSSLPGRRGVAAAAEGSSSAPGVPFGPTRAQRKRILKWLNRLARDPEEDVRIHTMIAIGFIACNPDYVDFAISTVPILRTMLYDRRNTEYHMKGALMKTAGIIGATGHGFDVLRKYAIVKTLVIYLETHTGEDLDFENHLFLGTVIGAVGQWCNTREGALTLQRDMHIKSTLTDLAKWRHPLVRRPALDTLKLLRNDDDAAEVREMEVRVTEEKVFGKMRLPTEDQMRHLNWDSLANPEDIEALIPVMDDIETMMSILNHPQNIRIVYEAIVQISDRCLIALRDAPEDVITLTKHHLADVRHLEDNFTMRLWDYVRNLLNVSKRLPHVVKEIVHVIEAQEKRDEELMQSGALGNNGRSGGGAARGGHGSSSSNHNSRGRRSGHGSSSGVGGLVSVKSYFGQFHEHLRDGMRNHFKNAMDSCKGDSFDMVVKLRDVILPELESVYTDMVPVFPESYSIMDVMLSHFQRGFVAAADRIISNCFHPERAQVRDRRPSESYYDEYAGEDEESGDNEKKHQIESEVIFAALSFVEKYGALLEKLGEDTSMCENVFDLRDMKKIYLERSFSLMQEWCTSIVAGEVTCEVEIDDVADQFYTSGHIDVFRIANDQLNMLETKAAQGSETLAKTLLFRGLAENSLNLLRSYQQQSMATLISKWRSMELERLIAYVNNYFECTNMVSEFEETVVEVLELQPRNAVGKNRQPDEILLEIDDLIPLFQQSAKVGMSLLVDHFLIDCRHVMKKLLTNEWLNGYDCIGPIVATVLDYMGDVRKVLNVYHAARLSLEALDRLIFLYIDMILNKQEVALNSEVADRIQEDIDILEFQFGKVIPSTSLRNALKVMRSIEDVIEADEDGILEAFLDLKDLGCGASIDEFESILSQKDDISDKARGRLLKVYRDNEYDDDLEENGSSSDDDEDDEDEQTGAVGSYYSSEYEYYEQAAGSDDDDDESGSGGDDEFEEDARLKSLPNLVRKPAQLSGGKKGKNSKKKGPTIVRRRKRHSARPRKKSKRGKKRTFAKDLFVLIRKFNEERANTSITVKMGDFLRDELGLAVPTWE